MRKLPWNADAPKWECRARVRGVTAEGFTIWIPAGTDFRMADGSTWTGQDDSLDHYWYGGVAAGYGAVDAWAALVRERY